jgi:DNA-binding LacI/PurR family transcriptional regulator
LDRRYEELDSPYVGIRNREGAYLGTHHFIEAGFTKIGILSGFQRLSTMRDRLTGFLNALNDNGIPVCNQWILDSPLTVEAGREAARKVLSLPDRPQALFLNNNFLSLGALLALKDLNLRCPEDIALIGFDDHPWAAVSNPPLTVVSQPVKMLGREAAKLLMKYIQDDVVEDQKLELPCELVIRQSCCAKHKQAA